MLTTVLSEKGQIVIPAQIRARMGLQRGDRFAVDVVDGTLVLKMLPRNPLLSLRGAFRGDDDLALELVREHQKERLSR